MSASRWLPSLRARVLALAVLAALPGFAIAVMDAVTSLQQTEGAARASLSATFGHVQRDYLDFSGDAATELAVAASSLSGFETECPDAFHALAQQHPEYQDVGLVREDGQIICALSGPGRSAQPIDHALLRRAIELPGHAAVALLADSSNAAPRLMVVHALRKPGSSRRMIAFIATAFMPLLDVTADPFIHQARLLFIDTAGGLVEPGRGTPARADAGMRKRLLSLSNRIRPAAPITVHIERMGAALVAWLPLGARGEVGLMALAIDRSALYGPAWQALLRNLSLMLAGLLLALVLLWWIGYRLILSPTQRLLLAMDRLARGDLRVRTGLAQGDDEIARLGMAFDRMAGDIERQAAERIGHLRSLERRNRLHAVLAAINAAILRRVSVTQLLEEICGIACAVGEFNLAWIGEVDAQHKTLQPVSWAGAHSVAIAELRLPLDGELPAGGIPSVTAARDGVVAVSNRYLADPHTAYWHDLGQQIGIHSAAAFPLGFAADGRRRTLTLGADREDYFEAEELQLLEQLAQDAAFGLHMIAAEQALAHTRTHDASTGLPNDILLLQHLHDALHRVRGTRKGVMVGVLEIGFQRLVSQWGSQPADELFKRIGQEIEAQLGEDDFVGVLTGARFAVIMGNLERIDDAERQIETLVERLQAVRIPQRDEFMAPTPRVGVAVFPDDGHDPHELLDRAQTALTVRHAGRSEAVHFYAPAISLSLQQNRKLEQQLRSALGGDELALHYQPIIDLASGALHGFEALLRWQHPDLGQVPPARFIPLAESSGLIMALGDWVVSEAARQALAWERLGASNLVITLNVSAVQIRDVHFGERVGQLLRAAGTQPTAVRLALELTESQLMADIDTSASLLAQLKAGGIDIILDDFGTGYSSLSYLHRLPVDALKIDRSFTASIDSSRKAAMIVEGILALARSLEIATVAEGIERAEQIERVKRMGCMYAQGFWFDRALTAPAAEQKWIARSLV